MKRSKKKSILPRKPPIVREAERPGTPAMTIERRFAVYHEQVIKPLQDALIGLQEATINIDARSWVCLNLVEEIMSGALVIGPQGLNAVRERQKELGTRYAELSREAADRKEVEASSFEVETHIEQVEQEAPRLVL
jgi:hypothetical protein